MQTAVNNRMPIGVVGQLADLSSMADAVVVTGTSEETSAQILFGKMVIQGTADDGILKPHTSAAAMVPAVGTLLKGILTFSNELSEPLEVGPGDNDGILPKTTAGVLVEGSVWVLPEEAVTPKSDVRVRVVAAGGEVAGSFRATADTTDCVEITAFARWETSGNSTTPAKLYINMANAAMAVADT